jgi:MFS family permease
MILLVRAHIGSFAVAGAAAAGFGLGSAVGNPVQGRLVDRHGHARVLLPAAAAHASALAAIVVLGAIGAPSSTLVACAVAAGLSIPAVGAIIRALLPGLLGDRRDLLANACSENMKYYFLVFGRAARFDYDDNYLTTEGDVLRGLL